MSPVGNTIEKPLMLSSLRVNRALPAVLPDMPLFPMLILWSGALLLSVSYLILPWYSFWTILAVAVVFGLGLIKPHVSFFIVILAMIEELSQLFFLFHTTPGLTYTVRYFVYIIPLVATFLGWGVALARRDMKIGKTPLDGVLLLIVAYQLISILWMPNPLMSGLVFITLLLNLVFYVLTTSIVSSEDMLRRVAKVIIITGVINATGIIASQWVSYTHEIFMSRTWGFVFEFSAHNTRPSGFGGANHTAGFTNLAIFMALGSMLWESRKKMKFVYFIAAAYMAGGVILTESRGGLFGLIGALVLFIFIETRFRGKQIRSLVMLVFILICLLFAVKPSLIDRILIGFGYTGELYFSEKAYFSGQAVSDSGHQGSLSGMDIRKVWWTNALRAMINKPAKLIFGLGCGGYLYYAKGSPEVNSIYFSFFFDMGLFGIAMLVLLLILIFSNLYKYMKIEESTYSRCMLTAAFAAMVAIIGIHGLIEYDLSSFGSKTVWFPLALTMAILNIVKTESSLTR